MTSPAGFREGTHTADWALHAWAPDLSALLEQAARGMYALSGLRLRQGPRQERHLELRALDAESLLVRFLSELLWLGQQEGLGFDTFELRVEQDFSLHADLSGAPILDMDKEIKAVTYHNLAVRQTGQGLEVEIVFDV
jgi:SHS2 domain-containing protein